MAKKKKRKIAKIINLQSKMSLQKYIKLNARKLAIHEAYMVDDLFSMGKGNVVFVRKKQNGQKLVGVYLVDTWCLGVKDTFYNLFEDFEYADFRDEYFSQAEFSVSVCDPNHACNVIYGATEYAEDLGIDPHPKFDVSEHILIDVEEVVYEELEFGYEGKPYYMPHDNDNKGAILSKLNASVGKDGYYYTYGEVFMDDDELSIYKNAAKQYLDVLEDRSSYIGYVNILMMIDQMCLLDIEGYRQIFINNHVEFLLLTYENGFDGVRQTAAANNADMDGHLLSVAESYFIHGGTDYILREEYVRAFAKDFSDNILGVFFNINIMEYGQSKINILVSYASKIMHDLEYEDYGVEDVRELYVKELENPDAIDEIKVLEIIFSFLEEYEGLYGEIDFDSVALNF